MILSASVVNSREDGFVLSANETKVWRWECDRVASDGLTWVWVSRNSSRSVVADERSMRSGLWIVDAI